MIRLFNFKYNSSLWVVDVQNGLINSSSDFLPSRLARFLSGYRKSFSQIIFTRLINSESSFLSNQLNWHGLCTEHDQSIHSFVSKYADLVVDLCNYTALNFEMDFLLADKNVVYLTGLDTDTSILKTALDLMDRGIEVYVLEKYVASSGGSLMHNYAIEILKRAIGSKNVIPDIL